MPTPLQIIFRTVSAVALLGLGVIMAIDKGSWIPLVISLLFAVWVIVKG